MTLEEDWNKKRIFVGDTKISIIVQIQNGEALYGIEGFDGANADAETMEQVIQTYRLIKRRIKKEADNDTV